MFSVGEAGAVARIRIDRGQRRNAVPLGGWSGLSAAVDAALAGGAQAILLESGDPRAFSAGADISELTALADAPEARAPFRTRMADALDRLATAPVPTVALIAGDCFGAGVAIACACDIRVATPAARFAITPARLGIGYPAPDVARLVALVGRGQAARLLFGAITIDAAEALRIGLVESLDPPDALVAALAANAGSSLAALKATLAGAPGDAARFEGSFGSSAFAERSRAYRREPRA